VINAKVFSRKGVDKDERAKDIRTRRRRKLLKDRTTNQDPQGLGVQADQAAPARKETTAKLVDDKGPLCSTRPGSDRHAARRDPGEVLAGDRRRGAEEKVAKILENFNEQKELVKLVFGEKISRLRKGDELPPGSSRWSRSTWPSSASWRWRQDGRPHGNKASSRAS